MLVPYGLWTVFQSLHFSEESCKCQMIHNQMTSKSIIMEFLHAGFSNVTKCSASNLCGIFFSLATFSVSVMDVSYYNQYSYHTSHPLWKHGPYVIHDPEQQLFFHEQHSCNKHYANGLECIKLKWFMKVNIEVMYYYQYS